MKQKWNDLNIKAKLSLVTAAAAFTFGWGLTLCAAFIPLLLSEQGILFILGEGMIYCGSVLGISMYFRSEQYQMKSELKRYFNEKERLQIERMKLRNGIDVGELPIQDNYENNDEDNGAV